ncbi:MAG TPA: glycosyltransferase family 2 protein [Chitinophagaceae bacterium]|jgi:glycosyltransferase involved in cell wall biosynthesis|nr:glycosyltransferase family 2 protein [Chitinophagaceae bacterium]HMU59899.1 glycosyltransferase family 2 protein [Chitinophagaceae bacterium]
MKLSIVTINYNNAEGLQKTIESVVKQSFKAFEYIIIDGGSSDGSNELLNKHNDSISYWVSEPDKGIYNAMNKGIKKAQGEYLLFLNSGDYLFDNNTIENVLPLLKGEDIIAGQLVHFNEEREWYNNPPDTPAFDFFTISSLPHPATFIKRELFEKYGYYSEQLKICSDWKFFMDVLVIHKRSYKKVDFFISMFNEDGISSDPNNLKKIKEERRQVIVKDYGGYLYDHYFYSRDVLVYIKHSRLIHLFKKIGFFKSLKLD